jgi:putative DNA methylase
MRDEAARRIGHLYPDAMLPDGSKATVIAWLWARTVRSPDPAAKGAMVPLVSSFMLSTKEGKKTWVEPVVDAAAPDGWRFEVRAGNLTKVEEERLKKGTKAGHGANFTCILSGAAINGAHIKREALEGRMSERLLAIVAEASRSRRYLSPTAEHAEIALSAQPTWQPDTRLPDDVRAFTPILYGMTDFSKLFTPRQLVSLTTFSDLVTEVRERVLADAISSRSPDDFNLLSKGGNGAVAYADAVADHRSALGIAARRWRHCETRLDGKRFQ